LRFRRANSSHFGLLFTAAGALVGRWATLRYNSIERRFSPRFGMVTDRFGVLWMILVTR
jgi:uncharacterized glyoxalase superfamily protein PhnB